MKVNKLVTILVSAVLTAGILAGCGNNKENTAKSEGVKKQVIKLGVTGDEHKIWDNIKDRLAKENIELRVINFGDYIRPNMALNDGEIDANAFQTVAYFEKFKADHKLDLSSLGYTVLAPMGIYSSSLKSIKDVKEGGKVAIPNDASNGGRALLLLQDAGLIKLKEGSGIAPTLKDIIDDPKNLKISELVATQIPRSIKDVDIAVINNGVAVEAGYSPLKDSIYIEDVKKDSAKNYFNIIAVKSSEKNNAALKRLIEVYQTEETKKLIEDIYKGSTLPAF